MIGKRLRRTTQDIVITVEVLENDKVVGHIKQKFKNCTIKNYSSVKKEVTFDCDEVEDWK